MDTPDVPKPLLLAPVLLTPPHARVPVRYPHTHSHPNPPASPTALWCTVRGKMGGWGDIMGADRVGNMGLHMGGYM